MKTTEFKLSKDEFAKFMFTKGLETKCYNYDIMYDIAFIIRNLQEKLNKYNASIGSDPVYVHLRFFFKKETGSWIFEDSAEKELLQYCRTSSDEEYIFTFCVNFEYFRNIPFCTLQQVEI